MAGRGRRERSKSLLLAILVALSLSLVVLVWTEAPGSGYLGRPQPYVAAGSSAQAGAGAIPLPRYLLVRREGRLSILLRDSGTEFSRLWRAAVAELGPGRVRVLDGPAEVTARQAYDLARDADMLEVRLSGTLTFGDWLVLLGNRLRAGGAREGFPDAVLAERVDRFIMVPEQGGLTLLLGGERWQRLTLEGDGRLRQALSSVREGIPARELRDGTAGLRLLPGVVVPAVPDDREAWPPMGAQGEEIVRSRLAGALFPNVAVVRQVEGRQGQILLTDGERSLLVSQGGSFAYKWTAAPRARRARAPAELVRAAVEFVQSAGGWPVNARLWGVEQVADGAGWLLSLEFTPTLAGLPVLNVSGSGFALPDVTVGVGTADDTPGIAGALRVTVTQGGTVRSYVRAVRLPGGAAQAGGTILPPEGALASLARSLGGAGARDLAVREIYLAYCALPDAGGGFALRPAWVFELAGPGSSLIRRAVDALPEARGRVYGEAAEPVAEGEG